MSTVIIRSQNRQGLYNFNAYGNIQYAESKADRRHSILLGTPQNDYVVIGKYDSKERCLEVIDDAQKKITRYLTVLGGAAIQRGGLDVQPAVYNIPICYEMPEA